MPDDPYEQLRRSTPEERRAAVRAPGLVRAGSPPNAFDTVWLGVLVCNAYWFPLRACSRVELQADELRWRTPLRSSRVPLADVTRLGPFPLATEDQLLRSTRRSASPGSGGGHRDRARPAGSWCARGSDRVRCTARLCVVMR